MQTQHSWAGNTFTYTTSNGKVVWPDRTAKFGDAEYFTNVYQNGKGTIYFDRYLECIGDYAFCSCTSLTSITIPSSVTTIQSNAFSYCTALTSVYVGESIAEIYNAFEGIPASCTLYVPKGYKSAYQNAPGWNAFQNIEEYGDAIQGHEYVDLGLPSGLLWATCNIGADRPEQGGSYYAWGEIEAKDRYDWNTYQLGTQASNDDISTFGIKDGQYDLDHWHDAAAMNWGSEWSIPSKMQFTELICRCTWRQTTVNGVLCMEGKGPNGNKILFPYAGAMNITDCQNVGNYGTYWTSEVNADQCYRSKVFFISNLYSKPEMWDNSGLRYIGNSIRPVTKKENGILEGGICGVNLYYTIYDDLSMKVEGQGNSYNDYHYFGIYCGDYITDWRIGQYWNQVKTISLPEGLTGIYRESFRGCNFTSITIPNNVTYIGEYAFADCNKLTSMYVGPNPSYCSQNAFSGIQSTCTLYVPAGCKSVYQQTDVWKGFSKIVEYGSASELATTNNALYIDNVEAMTGETCTLAIKMKNNITDLTGVQFTLKLPEGVNVATDQDGDYLISLNAERVTTNHIASANVESDGTLRVMVVSLQNKVLKGTDGDLVYVTLNIASNAPSGITPLTLQDVVMTPKASSKVSGLNYQGEFSLIDYYLGDVNHDRSITISDAIGAINLWLSSDVTGLYTKHADINRDGKINVSDVVWIIEKVINAEP